MEEREFRKIGEVLLQMDESSPPEHGIRSDGEAALPLGTLFKLPATLLPSNNLFDSPPGE